MKKFIALILVIMCSSLVACSNNTEKGNANFSTEMNNTQVDNTKKTKVEKDIIGTWENSDDRDIRIRVTVNDNYTGKWETYFNQPDYVSINFKWQFSNEFDCITFVEPGISVIPIFIEEDNGKEYIMFNREKCYRVNVNE